MGSYARLHAQHKTEDPSSEAAKMPSVLVNDTMQQYKSHKQLPPLWVTRLIKTPHCVWAQAWVHTNMLRCTQALQQAVLKGISDTDACQHMHMTYVYICISAPLLMKLDHPAAVTGPTPHKIYIWRCSASANSREKKQVCFNFP